MPVQNLHQRRGCWKWSKEPREFHFLHCMWVLVAPLNPQGPEQAKASHPIVIPRKALALSQPHLPYLQNGPHQLFSLSRAVTEDESGGSMPP